MTEGAESSVFTHRIYHTLVGLKTEDSMGAVITFLTTDGIPFDLRIATVHRRDDQHYLIAGEVFDRGRPYGAGGQKLYGAIALSTLPHMYGKSEQARIGVVLVYVGASDEWWVERGDVTRVFRELSSWEFKIKRPAFNRLLNIVGSDEVEQKVVSILSGNPA
ncbi:MAG: hypothetical protein A2591_03100 [Candidatus Yonathbacteria bacterium RIFOXYD1_FULL_52_36]|uniref:Uncharacterized protein n=1 Tax=Candidatus Yonathbacteria bacterium RIFOXYD1_FULL_52_36 TaxID=1802730 RepID=A0A1G2SNM0_9BACT|nr:MAG: hypothetical protein A2591_03100 [Candidatus Yonathbacteria bacterium RIFOXYD1_FULL_52_36]